MKQDRFKAAITGLDRVYDMPDPQFSEAEQVMLAMGVCVCKCGEIMEDAQYDEFAMRSCPHCQRIYIFREIP